jgi:hypothetical protein
MDSHRDKPATVKELSEWLKQFSDDGVVDAEFRTITVETSSTYDIFYTNEGPQENFKYLQY